ncbi:hypothetical protein KIH74_19775 [Kineosporia sp. J2-2]|uniref:Flp family type IVb pilin n=1 Tax=Kineosporia corallincola TaxID=2835133 RepID=A0ABS5TJJ8_9ACTN|nr:hypothetical protein [Kineosporia corallincola]MBT0771190.1 hypothetical protein [Kineosporia corallincola]
MSRGRTCDTGASVVEYGLIVCGAVAAFLAAFIGLQALFAGVFGRVVSSVEPVAPTESVRMTPLGTTPP